MRYMSVLKLIVWQPLAVVSYLVTMGAAECDLNCRDDGVSKSNK